MTTTDHTPSVDVPPNPAGPGRPITQYSRRRILTIWAAAAIPMAGLSWIVAPAIADGGDAESLFKPLLACMAVGLRGSSSSSPAWSATSSAACAGPG